MPDISMPMFGRAGQGPNQADWGEVDNFDVELLAEYLLEDSSGVPGVTFDFNSAMENNGIVSPENSEDGGIPTIADMSAGFSMAMSQQQHQFMHHPNTGTMTGSIPLAPAPFPNLPVQVPNLASAPAPMSFIQHAPPASAAQQAPKRRRVEDGMAAVTSMPDPSTFLNGQQLAAAAAQALSQGRGRKKSQAQIDRRRERNRILARRTRLRKKFFFESLQKEVMDLQKQNQLLKQMVKDNIEEEEGKKILDECDALEKLPPSVLEAIGEGAEVASEDFNLVTSIQRSQHAFIITDPSLQDNPIVFASEGFLQLTGYAREQVLGRNCRFLQGTESNPEKIKEISTALANGDDVGVTLINYMADGTPFWNKLFIAALRDAQNNIVNYIGVLVKVACPEPGDPDHGKTLPNVGPKAGEDDEDDEDDDDASG
uniref:LOV domain-containing protein n=1 Tax=Amphora coffeiformis TaxID=265554 RepID=A0A6S8IZY1_9STRA|mmetsp:Transcript_9407/g.17950  ORF Transcript_9407/g.17950 Transcript_9407/m.17950 type:complete len:427 (+) Transcript_9407:925-2205(+)